MISCAKNLSLSLSISSQQNTHYTTTVTYHPISHTNNTHYTTTVTHHPRSNTNNTHYTTTVTHHPRSQNSVTVTRHPNTIKKLQTWDLSIWKKTLIIGDSNLDKIGTFYYEDLQIDSYPGANFLHAETLLRKSTAHCQVEKIILSFGINSRSARIKETVIKQMQKALKAAKD